MKRSVTFLIAVLAVAITVPAFAATKTATLNVTATVINNCKITTTDVVFGNYDPVVVNAAAGADIFQNGSVVVTCTKNAPGVWVDLDNGQNAASAGFGMTRAMKNGAANYLSYDLYKTNPNPGPGTVWGAGNPAAAGAGLAVTPGGVGAPNTLTVYGRCIKGQDPSAGAYADLITATVNY